MSHVEDTPVDGLGDKTGEIAFLASAFVGEELAQGFVEFFWGRRGSSGWWSWTWKTPYFTYIPKQINTQAHIR